jgi:ubiquinone/menaquinone biosynthesis C-methylase UbiE
VDPTPLYDSPDLYDLLFTDQGRSVTWYRALAHEAGGKVLDIACGTGRLTLALARDGCEVHAVDLSENMLKHLTSRLDPDLSVTVARADFRALPEAAYDIAILPFNALHHCTTEAEVTATFAGLARSVRAGGVVAVDAYLHDPVLTARGPGRHEVHTREIDGDVVTCWEESSWAPPKHHVTYGFAWPNGTEKTVEIVFHMYTLEVLRAAVKSAGLRVAHEASAFGDTPLDATSTKWVLIAEKP